MSHFGRKTAAGRILAVVAGLGVVAGPVRAIAANEGLPSLLASLGGQWRMEGDVRGKPVVYRLEGEAVLAGKFIELHMTDVGGHYEARVFIGENPKSGEIIAHWLDIFGAAYSIPTATGRIDGNCVTFTFAYADGPMKDVLVYRPGEDVWTLDMQEGTADGGWRHFAAYRIARGSP